jgi:hypothetical protein
MRERVFGLMVVALLLGGCESWVGSEEVPPPVGIGGELNQLKRSPCTCLELPQQYNSWQVPVS